MALFSKLGNYKNFGLLVIRAGLGIMFIYHGYPKIMGGTKMWEQLGGSTKYIGIHFLPVLWGFLCALVETLGGVLLIVGLGFRLVCILIVINLMVAATAMFGIGEGMDGAAHAIEDAVVFAGLIFVGPGRFSLDRK